MELQRMRTFFAFAFGCIAVHSPVRMHRRPARMISSTGDRQGLATGRKSESHGTEAGALSIDPFHARHNAWFTWQAGRTLVTAGCACTQLIAAQFQLKYFAPRTL